MAPLVYCYEAGEHSLGLEEAHREFQITPEEFDEVAAELGARSITSESLRVRRMKSWRPSRRTRGK